jgi:hypothetical protein
MYSRFERLVDHWEVIPFSSHFRLELSCRVSPAEALVVRLCM